jgi:hypothetical protein
MAKKAIQSPLKHALLANPKACKLGGRTTEVAHARNPHDLPPRRFGSGRERLFPKEAKAWKDVANDQGFLRIRPDVRLGIVGLYGSLALGNPPSPVDLLDHWEASKP